MSDKDLEEFVLAGCGFFTIWLFIVFSQIVYANIDPSTCGLKMTRIEYLFPGYQIGCWGRVRVK